MATLLQKSILKVGETMHSPDGPVPITAERLAHFAAEHKRLTGNSYAVPSRWEHADKPADMLPLAAEELPAKLDGRHAVGKMVGFDYRPGADQAELTLELSDARAAEQCESNRVKVSPIIAGWWKDGRGNEYTDFISHADLVERPVDYSQGDFKPVVGTVACSLEKWLPADTVRLAFPPKKSDAPGDDDEEGDESDGLPDSAPPEVDSAAPAQNPDSPPKATDKSKVAAVVEGFKSLGVVLPSDFDLKSDTAVDLLLTGLNTLIAAKVKADEESQEAEQDEEPATVASPGYAQMSTEEKNSRTFKLLEKKYREDLGKDLRTLLQEGRCTPEESREFETKIGVVRMSLDSDGNEIKGEVEHFIRSRQHDKFKHLFWSDEQRTKLSAEPAALPQHMQGPDDVDVDAAVQGQLERTGFAKPAAK